MEGRHRNWEEIVSGLLHEKVPPIWSGLRLYYSAWQSFGRDFNGHTLYSERALWIEKNCADSGEAEAAEVLFSALDAADAECEKELRERD